MSISSKYQVVMHELQCGDKHGGVNFDAKPEHGELGVSEQGLIAYMIAHFLIIYLIRTISINKAN